MRSKLVNEYFNWLYDLVCRDRYSPHISYVELLKLLHHIEFRYIIPRDQNRAENGKDMRYSFALDNDYDVDRTLNILDGPCSVLEMMVALAIKCEELMDDPHYGDRTAQWFWEMVTNLGLGSMHDDIFDEDYVMDVIDRFLDRRYEPDGRGGLFRVRGCDRDLREVEIWHQLCWYQNTIS